MEKAKEEEEFEDPNEVKLLTNVSTNATTLNDPTKKVKSAKPIDLTSHYSRFAQQLVADEFITRLAQLQARNVTPD